MGRPDSAAVLTSAAPETMTSLLGGPEPPSSMRPPAPVTSPSHGESASKTSGTREAGNASETSLLSTRCQAHRVARSCSARICSRRAPVRGDRGRRTLTTSTHSICEPSSSKAISPVMHPSLYSSRTRCGSSSPARQTLAVHRGPRRREDQPGARGASIRSTRIPSCSRTS